MSERDEKLPWLKFWPSDWRNDIPLRCCSLAARGLWIDMLCLMHDSDPYGTLPDENRLAKLIGSELAEIAPLMKELELEKVFSRDENGRIFSRRMQRDQQIRRQKSEAGKLGGNPGLKKKRLKR